MLKTMLASAVLFLATLPLMANNGPYNHMITTGHDRDHYILQYHYSLSNAWQTRTAVFSNLNPDHMTYNFNLGVERSIRFTDHAPYLHAGIDLLSFNTAVNVSDQHRIGIGPVAGFSYDFTDRFQLRFTFGAATYTYEEALDEFRWTWHRYGAFMAGWRF